MPPNNLRRIYAFSDTYGRSKNPFTEDDADALIATDFRSFSLVPVRREFDIYGREAMLSHVLRLIFQLHEDIESATYLTKEHHAEFAQSITGVFINWAPRTKKNKNGTPFYVATAKNIRIVTTNLDCLASVKDKIETLHHLPNENNNLYSGTEQFRSSFTAVMLLSDHGLKLIEDKLSLIPDFPVDRWELGYVDRFGNLVTYIKDPDKKWKEIEKAQRKDGTVKVVIGNVSQLLRLGTSLRDAGPGELVLYKNGDIDILRKWEEDEDPYTRLHKSAFFQFAKPAIGARIKIPKKG